MDQLKIVGTEDDKLILATESGDRFSLAIDEVLRGELRKAKQPAAQNEPPRASPRDIQAQIRAGLTATEVAELLGTTVEDVERFEGPVIAEREHIVTQALAVAVLMGSELEPDGTLSFGAAIRTKLAEAGAQGERWTSWKDETGWVIKVDFTASEIAHDARWSFDPRRSTLSPLNSDATQLSRQGSLPEGLIPRLRALEVNPLKDDSRFDSGAFGPRHTPAPEQTHEQPVEEQEQPRPATAADVAVKRAPEPQHRTSPDTADLLEALRRRRGQREPLPTAPQEKQAPQPQDNAGSSRKSDDGIVTLFGDLSAQPTAPDDDEVDDEEIVAEQKAAAERKAAQERKAAAEREKQQQKQQEQQQPGRRKGRTSMPSWDDIVFGARTDD